MPDHRGEEMKLIVDVARCEGHGLCEEAAPQLLHLDDAGDLVIDRQDLSGEDLAAANAAVRVCPVAALRVER
jgi:ferredoxin